MCPKNSDIHKLSETHGLRHNWAFTSAELPPLASRLAVLPPAPTYLEEHLHSNQCIIVIVHRTARLNRGWTDRLPQAHTTCPHLAPPGTPRLKEVRALAFTSFVGSNRSRPKVSPLSLTNSWQTALFCPTSCSGPPWYFAIVTSRSLRAH